MRTTRSTAFISHSLLWVVLSIGGCMPEPSPSTQDTALFQAAAVAAADFHGTEAAKSALESGGNAVDAAVATAFALAVTLPEAGNIGGGGFMLLHVDGENRFLDYRETAPARAHRDMYLDDQGEVKGDASFIGHLAVGVPGTVRGLWAAHQAYGSLPWEELVEPAIRLAEEGFVVPASLIEVRDEASSLVDGKTNFDAYFSAMQAGETFRQPELGETLRRIASDGPRDFYEGKTAELIVAEMDRGGGWITLEDLSNYRPEWREPLIATWESRTVVTAPPPSSGGIALLQLLSMKQMLAPHFEGVAHNSAQYVHLVAEIEKRVFADRAEYLGDPGFVSIPVEELIAEPYLEERVSQVQIDVPSPTEGVAPGLESHQTTHFSIVDRWGNAVSNTYTLNWDFGAAVVVEGAGFLLNDEMDDFSIKPGVPNIYGVVGNDANAVAPGKRMLSSMTPTMVLGDHGVELVLGSPGGPTIFTSVFQVIVNLYDHRMTLEEAVGTTRFHHQLLPPQEITFDPDLPLPDDVIESLREKGYSPRPHDWRLGDIQAIRVVDGRPEAASDPRGRGTALTVP